MGHKGWSGTPPPDDAAAVERILATAVALVQERGAAATTMSAVADELGITRRTLYRYFTGVDALFSAVGEHAFATYEERLAGATQHLEDPAELAIESVAWIVETIATEPLLTLLLEVGHTTTFTRTMLSAPVVEQCRVILQQRRVDWSTVVADDAGLDELVELLLRLIQSLVLAPADPPRSPAQLRAVLRRWLGPVFSS